MEFDRRRYPWIALAAIAFGLAVAGYTVDGISVTALFPLVVASGLLVVAVRPTAYGDVMIRLGILSLCIAGLLALGGTDLSASGFLALVGTGGLLVGRRANRQLTAEGG